MRPEAALCGRSALTFEPRQRLLQRHHVCLFERLRQFVRDHDMTDRACLDALQAFVKATAGTETLADDFSTILARFS